MKRTVFLTTIGTICLIGNLAGISHAIFGVPNAPYGSFTRFFYSLQAPFQSYNKVTSVLSIEIETPNELYIYPLSSIWPYSRPIQSRLAGFHSSYTTQYTAQQYAKLAAYVFTKEQQNNPAITTVRVYITERAITAPNNGSLESSTQKRIVAHYSPNE